MECALQNNVVGDDDDVFAGHHCTLRVVIHLCFIGFIFLHSITILSLGSLLTLYTVPHHLFT